MEIEEIKPRCLNNLVGDFGYLPLEYASVRYNEHLCLCSHNGIPVAIFKIKISPYFRTGVIEHGPVLSSTPASLSELCTLIVKNWSLNAIKIRAHLEVTENNVSELYKLTQRYLLKSVFSFGNVWSTLLLDVKDLNGYKEIKARYRKGLKSDLSKASRAGLFVRERGLNDIDNLDESLGREKKSIIKSLISSGYHGKIYILEVVKDKSVLGFFVFHESNRILRYFSGDVLMTTKGLPISHVALDYMIQKATQSELIDTIDFWGYNLISLDKKILGINGFKSSFRGKEKVYLPAIRLSRNKLGRLLLWSV